MSNNCDVDRWPLCCKAHRTEVYAEMAADAVADAKSEGCTWLVLDPHPFGDPSDPAMYDDETEAVGAAGIAFRIQVLSSGAVELACRAATCGAPSWPLDLTMP